MLQGGSRERDQLCTVSAASLQEHHYVRAPRADGQCNPPNIARSMCCIHFVTMVLGLIRTGRTTQRDVQRNASKWNLL